MSIEWMMPSNHLILCRPLLLLPLIPPTIRVFSNESTLHMRWPKYWRFSFTISPSKEHPGLISFRMDWGFNLHFFNYEWDFLSHLFVSRFCFWVWLCLSSSTCYWVTSLINLYILHILCNVYIYTHITSNIYWLFTVNQAFFYTFSMY